MKAKLFFILTFIVSANICQHIKAQILYVPGGTGGIGNNTTNGNVGIGTGTPNSRLDVIGDIQISNASIPMGLMTEVGGFTPLLNLSLNFREPNKNNQYKGAAFRIDTRDGFPIFQWLYRPPSSNEEKEIMSLNNSGNLGLGTMNPSNLQGWHRVLDVNGEAHSKILATAAGETYRTGIFSHNEGWYGGGGFIGTESNHNLFLISGYSPKMAILTNGNVLIGKTIQTNGEYKLDVAGKIRANEIVVNTSGADFVFESSYNLRSLKDLEIFIIKNKHLPDITPAKQMQENGINSGEMLTKLLQKVEELTLYLIEKDKQINDQQKRIEKQEFDNEEMREVINEMKKELELLKLNN